jgi:hypothetical protein
MNQKRSHILLAAGLILLVASFRIVSAELHMYHFAPVAALGLFSGAVVKDKRFAFLFTLLAQLVSDLYIQFFTPYPGFYGVEQLFVYGAMLLITLMGTGMGRPGVLKIAGYSIAGSLLFFLVSNFGVWVSIQMGTDLYGYGTGITGLMNTFLMALPFYSENGTSLFFNSMFSNLVGSGFLFGLYYLLQPKATMQLAASNA